MGENPIVKLTTTLTPSYQSIRNDVADFCKGKNEVTCDDLASAYGDRICWKYASVGVASALPSVIPGLGTAVQIATEASTVTADLALMLRWMGAMTCGIGVVYDRDIETEFNHDFVKVLGLWCGVLKAAENATKRVGTKVAIAQFNKIPGKIFQRINRKVGTTLLTKYGTKRGGIAVGKLIPFGVGAAVGGSFNLVTMKAFRNSAINFYRTDAGNQLYMEG